MLKIWEFAVGTFVAISIRNANSRVTHSFEDAVHDETDHVNLCLLLLFP